HPVRPVPQHPGQRPRAVPATGQGRDPLSAGLQDRRPCPSVWQGPHPMTNVAPIAAEHAPPPHLELIGMVAAIWKARALYAAASLGLADLLEGGPRDVATLAVRTGTHAASLHRLLRALASFGVFTEVAPQRFGLTRLGAALRRDAPGAARSAVLTLG